MLFFSSTLVIVWFDHGICLVLPRWNELLFATKVGSLCKREVL